MRLCHNGEWRTLLLDDSFPCLQSNPSGVGVPAFAYGARRQLWVALIEKAFAKLHGCYEALDGGTTDEALETLTGFPCERLDLRLVRSGGDAKRSSNGVKGEGVTDPELLWAQLLSSHQAGLARSAFACVTCVTSVASVTCATNRGVRCRRHSCYVHSQAGFLLSASVGNASSSEDAAIEAMGLLSGHAYSLLRGSACVRRTSNAHVAPT